MNTDEHRDRLDAATADRLAQLAARPVDTTGLARRLDAELRRAAGSAPPVTPARRIGWRSGLSAAAAVLLVLTLGYLAIDGGTSPAVAAPYELAQIHHRVAGGLAPQLTVSSVAEANRLLRDQAQGEAPLPFPELPGDLMSCCLLPHAGTTLTCALIDRGGVRITVALADADRLHAPPGPVIEHAGRRYHAHTADGVRMVMTHQEGRWLCVMGDADTDALLDVAAAITF